MKYPRLSLLAMTLSTLFISNAALAAAFQFYELGTPIIGTAGVGQAAEASDASTSYFNPAGMTQLSSSQFMLGSQIIVPYQSFARNNRSTIRGNNGGNAGSLTPGLDLYYVYSQSPRLKLGVSLTQPYGGMLSYNDGWVGRYLTQNIEFYTLNLNPALAYQVTNWLSVGVGVSMEYAYLQQTVAIPIIRVLGIDGQVNIKTNNFSPGANLGVLFTPTPSTKIGVAYRSRITHDLRGDLTFLRLDRAPSVSTTLVDPNNVIISLTQDIGREFTLLAETGWANWSTMHSSTLNVRRFAVSTPQHWIDTYRLGVGAQYKPMQTLMLQAGASFDSSPTSSSHRTPDLPMDRQVRLGLGVLYSPHKIVHMGFSYEYINLGNANINNVSRIGTVSGSYTRNYVNVIQASVNVDC